MIFKVSLQVKDLKILCLVQKVFQNFQQLVYLYLARLSIKSLIRQSHFLLEDQGSLFNQSILLMLF